MRKLLITASSALCLFATAAFGADWLTDGGDVRRNNWQKDETTLTSANVKDMKLLWKIKLESKNAKNRDLGSGLEHLEIVK